MLGVSGRGYVDRWWRKRWWSRGLVDWAQTFSTRSNTRLAHLLSFASLLLVLFLVPFPIIEDFHKDWVWMVQVVSNQLKFGTKQTKQNMFISSKSWFQGYNTFVNSLDIDTYLFSLLYFCVHVVAANALVCQRLKR